MSTAVSSIAWVHLGCCFSTLRGRLCNSTQVILGRFGNSTPLSEIAYQLYRHVDTYIWSDLDNVVCGAFPFNIETLPGYPEIRLTRVFHDLYYDDQGNVVNWKISPHRVQRNPFAKELLNVGFRRRTPKSLSLAQQKYIIVTLAKLEAFIAPISIKWVSKEKQTKLKNLIDKVRENVLACALIKS